MTRDCRRSGGSFSPAARGLSRMRVAPRPVLGAPARGLGRPGDRRARLSPSARRIACLTRPGGDATMPAVLLRRVLLLIALPLALARCGESERPNIVLIILDTARADRFPF